MFPGVRKYACVKDLTNIMSAIAYYCIGSMSACLRVSFHAALDKQTDKGKQTNNECIQQPLR